MSLYILDTDHVTLSQHGNSKILQRAQVVGSSNIFVTTVTLEEQLKGRLASISKCAINPELLAVAHRNLRKTQVYFCSMNLLEFDEAAYNCYQSLRWQKIKIGTQDLRIAAIALANQSILVTRNHQDFNKVPNLSLQDWTMDGYS
ncbi:type II toxin-antitoxin system VapC family toxin [Nostoc sp.]|uniref:type II toxin-antitoxin system VapC family toxin n=1 Tax=Nostoc sp. TaxID=1180 RepID=UPI002FF5F2F7